MRTASVIFFLFLFSYAGNAQYFQKVIYSPQSQQEEGAAIDVFSSGHIIGGLASESSSYFGPYLLKTDEAGNRVWDKLYGFGIGGKSYDVLAAADGGFVLTGTFHQLSYKDTTFLIKTDGNGNKLWSKLFHCGQGDDDCSPGSLIETADGGYAVTGICRNVPNFATVFVIKTDANGNLLWAKTFDIGNGAYINGKCIVEDASGNLIIAVKTLLTTEGQVFLKINSTGVTQATRVYKTSGTGYTYPLCVSMRTDNTFDILCAEDRINDTLHLLTVHADSLGMLLDSRRYRVQNFNGRFVNARQISDSEIILSGGFAASGSINYDAVLMKIDAANGTVTWTKAYGSSRNEMAYDARMDASGNFVLTGIREDTIFYFGDAPDDIYYLKTDANGNATCNSSELTAASEVFSMTDSAYALIESDVTSTAYFADFNPLERNYFYQDTTVCLGVGVNELAAAENDFRLYPNPASEEFKVQSLRFEVGAQLSIVDLAGKEIFTTQLSTETSNLKLQTSNFENGVYFVRVKSGDTFSVNKLIIQR